LIANAYISSRAMFGGATVLLGTYGTLANPAFAIGLWFTNITSKYGGAYETLWLYPTFPFVGAILALIFYELVFNKHVQTRAEIVSDAHSEPGDLEE